MFARMFMSAKTARLTSRTFRAAQSSTWRRSARTTLSSRVPTRTKRSLRAAATRRFTAAAVLTAAEVTAAEVTADALETDIENNYFSDVEIVGDDLRIAVTKNNGTETERALLVGGLGKDFVVNGLVAQVGSTAVNVDDKAEYYLALGANATVNVGGRNDANIRLNDPDSGKEFEGDFTVIDARNSTGKSKLAGNTADNVIYAGSGATSLWGGNGGNDLLNGGAGVDEFYYAAGNGSDTINAGIGDSVCFVNITLDDITIDTVTSTAVAFSFKDGGKLTVNDNNSGVSFTVGNETYRLNGNREFERK